jgi:hypothetical protein
MAAETRVGDPPCECCGRTTPAHPLYHMTDFQLGLMRDVRDRDLVAGDHGVLIPAYIQGLLYEVTTHNGRRRRWRLTPAGEAAVAEWEARAS